MVNSDQLREALTSVGMQTKRQTIQPIGRISEEDFDNLKILWGRFAWDGYVYNDFNKSLLNNLMAYFLRDERIKETSIDLGKGIMLVGKKGVGKSTIFMIFSNFLQSISKFGFFSGQTILNTSVEKIKSQLLINGNIEKYGWNEVQEYSRPYEIVINEFGIDYDCKYFGTSFSEVISGLLMTRYDIYISKNIKTHITTNLDTADLGKKYDPMLIDRFKEMFNVIHLDGESFRK